MATDVFTVVMEKLILQIECINTSWLLLEVIAFIYRDSIASNFPLRNQYLRR